tara:strand:+ start:61 stop:207 length:147 start_codon:yes stop_codon:yes gene_type:complete
MEGQKRKSPSRDGLEVFGFEVVKGCFLSDSKFTNIGNQRLCPLESQTN